MLFTAASFGVILAVSADNQKAKISKKTIGKSRSSTSGRCSTKGEAVAEENAPTETKSETEDQIGIT